ncbi:hypothetical protein QWI17_12315 [Gilvimarinus sp. SDUM040013]|uniref:ATP-binding protein n=1 Tax=Gilvimarinus gilvus TaxID=3058038 RepID=A0ABU4RZA7_9GAMM|nr:hypothetical protein [Gilvimarinus sp. SDUM040013]MDO3386622.1 hypothetical protein [Gilvimarinus sp. SDUM040013]MDX6849491.1 hypothetical protein [Gilvimarinus sp. SDUM040013]
MKRIKGVIVLVNKFIKKVAHDRFKAKVEPEAVYSRRFRLEESFQKIRESSCDVSPLLFITGLRGVGKSTFLKACVRDTLSKLSLGRYVYIEFDGSNEHCWKKQDVLCAMAGVEKCAISSDEGALRVECGSKWKRNKDNHLVRECNRGVFGRWLRRAAISALSSVLVLISLVAAVRITRIFLDWSISGLIQYIPEKYSNSKALVDFLEANFYDYDAILSGSFQGWSELEALGFLWFNLIKHAVFIASIVFGVLIYIEKTTSSWVGFSGEDSKLDRVILEKFFNIVASKKYKPWIIINLGDVGVGYPMSNYEKRSGLRSFLSTLAFVVNSKYSSKIKLVFMSKSYPLIEEISGDQVLESGVNFLRVDLLDRLDTAAYIGDWLSRKALGDGHLVEAGFIDDPISQVDDFELLEALRGYYPEQLEWILERNFPKSYEDSGNFQVHKFLKDVSLAKVSGFKHYLDTEYSDDIVKFIYISTLFPEYYFSRINRNREFVFSSVVDSEWRDLFADVNVMSEDVAGGIQSSVRYALGRIDGKAMYSSVSIVEYLKKDFSDVFYFDGFERQYIFKLNGGNRWSSLGFILFSCGILCGVQAETSSSLGSDYLRVCEDGVFSLEEWIVVVQIVANGISEFKGTSDFDVTVVKVVEVILSGVCSKKNFQSYADVLEVGGQKYLDNLCEILHYAFSGERTSRMVGESRAAALSISVLLGGAANQAIRQYYSSCGDVVLGVFSVVQDFVCGVYQGKESNVDGDGENHADNGKVAAFSAIDGRERHYRQLLNLYEARYEVDDRIDLRRRFEEECYLFTKEGVPEGLNRDNDLEVYGYFSLLRKCANSLASNIFKGYSRSGELDDVELFAVYEKSKRFIVLYRDVVELAVTEAAESERATLYKMLYFVGAALWSGQVLETSLGDEVYRRHKIFMADISSSVFSFSQEAQVLQDLRSPILGHFKEDNLKRLQSVEFLPILDLVLTKEDFFREVDALDFDESLLGMFDRFFDQGNYSRFLFEEEGLSSRLQMMRSEGVLDSDISRLADYVCSAFCYICGERKEESGREGANGIALFCRKYYYKLYAIYHDCLNDIPIAKHRLNVQAFIFSVGGYCFSKEEKETIFRQWADSFFAMYSTYCLGSADARVAPREKGWLSEELVSRFVGSNNFSLSYMVDTIFDVIESFPLVGDSVGSYFVGHCLRYGPKGIELEAKGLDGAVFISEMLQPSRVYNKYSGSRAHSFSKEAVLSEYAERTMDYENSFSLYQDEISGTRLLFVRIKDVDGSINASARGLEYIARALQVFMPYGAPGVDERRKMFWEGKVWSGASNSACAISLPRQLKSVYLSCGGIYTQIVKELLCLHRIVISSSYPKPEDREKEIRSFVNDWFSDLEVFIDTEDGVVHITNHFSANLDCRKMRTFLSIFRKVYDEKIVLDYFDEESLNW